MVLHDQRDAGRVDEAQLELSGRMRANEALNSAATYHLCARRRQTFRVDSCQAVGVSKTLRAQKFADVARKDGTIIGLRCCVLCRRTQSDTPLTALNKSSRMSTSHFISDAYTLSATPFESQFQFQISNGSSGHLVRESDNQGTFVSQIEQKFLPSSTSGTDHIPRG